MSEKKDNSKKENQKNSFWDDMMESAFSLWWVIDFIADIALLIYLLKILFGF